MAILPGDAYNEFCCWYMINNYVDQYTISDNPENSTTNTLVEVE